MMQGQAGQILADNIAELFKLCLQLESKFSNLKPQHIQLIKILRLRIRALHLVFIMKATNKSALTSTELLLKELEAFNKNEEYKDNLFVKDLLQSVSEEANRKPGALVRLINPPNLDFVKIILNFRFRCEFCNLYLQNTHWNAYRSTKKSLWPMQ